MRNKKIIISIIAILVVAVAGFVAYTLLKDAGIIASEETSDIQTISVQYESSSYNTTNATRITADNGNISVNGSGAIANGANLNITAGGTYVLSGDFTGQVTVSAAKQTVTLVLDNATITNKAGTAIYIQEVKQAFIASAEGSTNKIIDGEGYSTNYGEEDVDAAIYSKDDLIFIGDGIIEIDGNYNHGIHGKDHVQVLSGTLDIFSTNDGIVAKDYFAMKDGTVIIDSASDGIKSTEDTDTTLGYIVIDGGKLNITATGDAINSISRISITNGEFDITTGGGAGNTSSSYSNWGRWQSAASTETSVSAKGLKAEKYIIITNGTFNFNTSDDAIHSNASIVINDGNITIKTGDDAIHGDTAIMINNGDIDITQSHEGIESSIITINNGNISIVDDDDGLNASGGNDGSSTNGRPGQNNFSNSKGTIYINGGTLAINSRGDGIDSNGSIEMTGGYVTVDGPTDNGNGALDYDGSFKISGGTLIAAGASGMLQTPSSDSSQNIISIVFSSAQSANSTFTLKDSSGKTIADFTPSKSYASIIISTPSISQGESYTASINGQTITTLTVNNVITSYGAGGSMQGGGRR